MAAVVAAALTALLVAPAPSYDPWAWLLWGREIAHGTLSTTEGPAFKPLPVAVTTLLAPFGGAAPVLWVLVARTGMVVAIVLAFRLGRRLAGGSLVAGIAAGVGVALCGRLLQYSAAGAEPGWVIALALAATDAWRAERFRLALACGVGAALLRVEVWPFLLVAGLVLWRRQPQARPLLIGCAIAIPALWFIPELIGSGDVLRSGSRARIPNPGQPALASVPALASLREAVTLPLWPLWLGAFLCPRAARPLLFAGLGWIALVAVMAQAGFSGEPRYALPGAALVAIAGAIGIAQTRAWIVVMLLLAAALPRLADLPDLQRDQAYQQRLARDLTKAIDAAGGRDALLACGRPYVGMLRGPLLAYHLDVEKQRVGFVPRPPGVEFRSRLTATSPIEPPEVFSPRVRTDLWEVRSSTCDS